MQQTLDNQPDGRFVFRTIIDDDFLLRIMNYSDNWLSYKAMSIFSKINYESA